MSDTPASIQQDIEDIATIAIVPSILDVVCKTTGMGFACIARVTEEKWVACSVRDEISFGLGPGGELKLDTTICHEIRQHRQAVVIDNVAKDPAYAAHHTPLMYGLQSYISVPIILKDGSFFGTLCAIDPKPALLNTPQVRGMFACFVDLVALHLDNIRQKVEAEAALAEEKEIAKLREGFIAILGHDLRNPVTAIKSSAELMNILQEYNADLFRIITNSATRINNLVDTMLDLARGRLAGGIRAAKTTEKHLQEQLQQVVDELKTVWPGRPIDVKIKMTKPVVLDEARIAQLFSNILGNALKYGNADHPVRVRLETENNVFRLSVTNAGKIIPVDAQPLLFQPFSRGADQASKPGLGLGLYIADEIARAHNGQIVVDSTDTETSFVFTMPLS